MDKFIILLLAAIPIVHGVNAVRTQRVNFTLFKGKEVNSFGRETGRDQNITAPLSGGIAVLIGIVEIVGGVLFFIIAAFPR